MPALLYLSPLLNSQRSAVPGCMKFGIWSPAGAEPCDWAQYAHCEQKRLRRSDLLRSLSLSLSSYCHSPVSISTQRASACRSDPPLYARLRASVVVLSSSRPLSSASPPSTVWQSPSLSATTTDATIDTASTSGALRLTHLSELERSCAVLAGLFENMHRTMLRHTHTTGRRTCFPAFYI